MKKFLLTTLILACTTTYAGERDDFYGQNPTQTYSNSNSTSGATSGSSSAAGAISGSVATGGQAVSGSQAAGGTGGTSTSGITATIGSPVSGATASTGASTSTSSGGSATGGQGGQGGSSSSTSNSAGGTSNATGGSSKATGGNSTAAGGAGGTSQASTGNSSSVLNNSVTVGCTSDCGANTTDKEIAAAHDQAARDVANTKIRNTPSMFGPALVSSNDTCMGSTSGSLATPGFGISIGSTWVDENCKMLKNSQALWNMGFRAASVALLCNDNNIKAALEITGYVCPVKQTQ